MLCYPFLYASLNYNLTALDVYFLPHTSALFTDSAENGPSAIPVRLTLSGTRASGNGGGIITFNNTFDWSDVQPVNLNYVNLATEDDTVCNGTVGFDVTLFIDSTSTLSLNPADRSIPPLTAFPPVFTAHMEALLSNASSVTNSPFTWSNYREFHPIADGSFTFGQNNQVLQAYNIATNNNLFEWYQFNHTANGGGCKTRTIHTCRHRSCAHAPHRETEHRPYLCKVLTCLLVICVLILCDSALYATGNYLITPAVVPNFTPWSCLFAYNSATNRSPLDYVHEAGLTKLYAMGNATTYVPSYHYAGPSFYRGIATQTYSVFISNTSQTDSHTIYNFTRTIHVIASGWQILGRANLAIGTDDTSLPLAVFDVGTATNMTTNVTVPFSTVVNFFSMFPYPNPNIYSPAAYHCPPFPTQRSPWLPTFAQLPASYSATITATSSLFNEAARQLNNPISLTYTEYYDGAQKLRVDGRAQDIDSVEIIQIGSTITSVMAANQAQNEGAFGYALALDAASQPANILLSSPCSQFSTTNAPNGSIIFTPSLSYWYNVIDTDAKAAIYSSPTNATEHIWSNSYDFTAHNMGALYTYDVTATYRFLVNGSAFLPLEFYYAIEINLDDTFDDSPPITTIYIVSVAFNQITAYTGNNALSAAIFPSAPAGCKTDTDYTARYGAILNAPTQQINPTAYTNTSYAFPASEGDLTMSFVGPLFQSANGDPRNYVVNWYIDGGIGTGLSDRIIERVDYALQDTTDPGYAASRSTSIYTYNCQH